MDVTVLYFDGCPNWQTTAARLTELAGEVDLRIKRVRVSTPEEAAATGFRGSPTVLVDGHDPFATGTEPTGLACRIYQTPDGPQGSPTIEQLRQALV
ncbi:MAG: hypothetical protein WD080_02630 [Egibacteraceae bacterium]